MVPSSAHCCFTI